MEELSINILVEAKTEYTKQLTNTLVPYLYEGIESIYDDAIELLKESNEEISTLRMFQNLLKKVPKWNQDIIDKEMQRILDRSQCVWLPDLIAAVFVANTKILTAVRTVDSKKKINLTITKVGHFLHKCYIECAREFYKNPFLMDKEHVNSSERQRNVRDSMKIIDQCICDAVRKLLPFQEILQQYLGESFADEDDISDNKYIKTPVKKSKVNQYLSESEHSNDDSDEDSHHSREDNDNDNDNDNSSEYTEEEIEITDSEDDDEPKKENIVDILKQVKQEPDVEFNQSEQKEVLEDTRDDVKEDSENSFDSHVEESEDKNEEKEEVKESEKKLITINVGGKPSYIESPSKKSELIPVLDSGVKRMSEKNINMTIDKLEEPKKNSYVEEMRKQLEQKFNERNQTQEFPKESSDNEQVHTVKPSVNTELLESVVDLSLEQSNLESVVEPSLEQSKLESVVEPSLEKSNVESVVEPSLEQSKLESVDESSLEQSNLESVDESSLEDVIVDPIVKSVSDKVEKDLVEKDIKTVSIDNDKPSSIKKKKKILIRRKVKKQKNDDRKLLFPDAEDSD